MKRKLDFRRGDVLAGGSGPAPEEATGIPHSEQAARKESSRPDKGQVMDKVSYQEARQFMNQVGRSMSGS